MLAHARSLLVVAGTVATSLVPLPVTRATEAAEAATAEIATAAAASSPSSLVSVAVGTADTTNVPRVYFEDGVLVTASRYDTDVHLSQTNLTSAEISLRESAHDIPLILERVPGLFAYSDAGNGIGYTYLSIRGFDQRKVGVLIDGIPLNDPEDQKVYWVNLPDMAASLEDIQVQRGITNSIGGVTAVGGTVNLVTEEPRANPGGRAAVEAGSFGTNRRVLSYHSGALGNFATSLRLSQIESDGYRDRSGAELWSVFWSGRYATGRHRLTANFFTGHEVTHHAWWAIDEERLRNDRTWNPETYHNAIDDFRQPQYQLHHEVDLAADLLLRNSVFVIHGEGYYENFVAPYPWDLVPPANEDDPPTWAQRYSLDYFLDLPDTSAADLVRQLWTRKDQVGWVPSLTWTHRGGRLIVGGDAYTYHSNYWGDVKWVEGFTPGEILDAVKYHDYTGDKDAWSVYANERYEILPGVTALADLQYQHRRYEFKQNEMGNFRGDLLNRYTVRYDFFNPKGGLFWDLPGGVAGGKLGLYGHVAVTHQEPSSRDFWPAWQGPEDLGVAPLFASGREVTGPDGRVRYVAWSDPQVVAERFVNWEGGVGWHNDRVSVTVNGYWTDVRNEIVITGIIDEIGYQERVNAAQTYHRGVEIGLRAWLGKRHTFKAALSRSWDRHEDFRYRPVDAEPVDFSGNPIALFPEYLASASLLSDWGPVLADLHLRAAGKQYLDNTGDAARTIDPWARLDLAVHWRLGRTPGLGALAGATAFVRVFNVLDAEYETWGYYDPWADVPGNQKLPAAPRNFLAGVRYEF